MDTDRIHNYYFAATQPENMAEYDVWFPTGTSSTVAFSATKKNPVMVYPISAKQMVSGVLVDKTAKSWQNGKWVDWIKYLYKDGKFYNGTEFAIDSQSGTSSITYKQTAFYINAKSGGYLYLYFPNKENLTDIKTIRISAYSYKAFTSPGTADYQAAVRLVASTGIGLSGIAAQKHQYSLKANTVYTIDLDVSTLDGEYYIQLFFLCSSTGSGEIDMDIQEVILLE